MPIVTAGVTPVNMTDPLLFGQLYNSYFDVTTATRFTTYELNTGRTWEFNGSFTYDSQNFPVSGLITSIVLRENGGTVITFTEINVSLQTFYQYLVNQSGQAFASYMLNGNDTITGSTGFDNLFGYLGDDTITAGNSGDALNGGGGNDSLIGGDGFDFIFGESGDDQMSGGGGNDRMEGSFGIDTINGNDGSDEIYGGDGNDILNGGEGHDYILGENDNDTINGGGGVDRIDGGSGNDTLNGGDGDDTITTGTGVDDADGGAGADWIVLDRSTSSASFNINLNELSGSSSVVLADGSQLRNFEYLDLRLGSGNDTFIVNSTLILPQYGPHAVFGGGGLDRLFADFTALTIAAGDLLRWGADIEELHVQGGSAADVMTGGSGNDELIGNGGADRLDGGVGGIDLLVGGEGDDQLVGGTGDTLQGGNGNDSLSVTFLSVTDTANITGGAGIDSLGLTWLGADAINLTLGAGGVYADIENFRILSGSGADVLSIVTPTVLGAFGGYFEINGGDGADRLTLNLSNATQAITHYNNSIDSPNFRVFQQGIETLELFAGSGNDRLVGGANIDLLHGGGGDDSIEGGDGNDQLFGDDGADTLVGGAGTNILNGGDGNDTIYGVSNIYGSSGPSVNTIDGGAGIDRYVVRQQYEHDILVWNALGTSTHGSTQLQSVESFDLETGWGDDQLTIIGPLVGNNRWDAFEFWTVIFVNGSPQLVQEVQHDRLTIDFSAWSADPIHFESYYILTDNYTLTVAGVDEFWFTGTAGNDYLHVNGVGADRLFGGDGDDDLRAAAGNDYISGGNGNDLINGWDGDDQLYGDGGNDTFIGLDGADQIFGGTGIDRSVYQFSSSTDVSWNRNPDGTWTVNASHWGVDSLSSVEVLDFLDRDVFLDRAYSTFSGDGTSDVFMRHSSGAMGLWYVNGSGVTGAAGLGAIDPMWAIEGVADFNGDGRDDILMRANNGNLGAWFMNGSSAQGAAGMGNISMSWDIAGLGDLNGDGFDDIIMWNGNGSLGVWFMNNGAVSGAAGLGNLSHDTWALEALADFNGDGREDILWRNNNGDAGIWFMDGGTATGAGIGNIPAGWAIEGAGDFNGDGRDDILMRDPAGNLGAWFMNGASATGVGLGNVSTDFAVAAIGDYNGDGRDDILWWHANGTLGAWFMNGAAASAASYGSVSHDWIINPGG